MSYLVQEINELQRRVRAHERLALAMALKIDALAADNADLWTLLAEVSTQRDLALVARDEAQDLLADLQREKIPALESVTA
jgi:hypothetical protein